MENTNALIFLLFNPGEWLFDGSVYRGRYHQIQPWIWKFVFSFAIFTKGNHPLHY